MPLPVSDRSRPAVPGARGQLRRRCTGRRRGRDRRCSCGAIARQARQPASSFTAIPLTAYPGREQQPSFSPDGSSVAFSWNGETRRELGHLRQADWAGFAAAPDHRPGHRVQSGVVSGRSLDRVRADPCRPLVVVVVPSRGGPEREVLRDRSGDPGPRDRADPLVVGRQPVPCRWQHRRQSRHTGDSHGRGRGDGRRRDGSRRRLQARTDSLPSVSPDGRMLAFVQAAAVARRASCTCSRCRPGSRRSASLDASAGQGVFYHGVAWSADGRDLIVSSGNTGDVGLWRIPLQSPERRDGFRPPATNGVSPPSRCSRTGWPLRGDWDENIWRLALSAPGRPAGAPVSLIGSTRSELNAQFSPDGTRIVFESQRSGTQEIWVADRDGRNALQLTSFNGRRGGTPAWSPDGQSIAFDLRNDDGRGDIYVIPARGGAAVRITNHPADDLVPELVA